MRVALSGALVLALFAPSLAFAQDSAPVKTVALAGSPEGFGIGVILGSPTGLALAYRWSDRHALASGLAWNFSHDDFSLHVDYEFTVWDFVVPETNEVTFPLYIGVGGRFRSGNYKWNDPTFGVRIPIGLCIKPRNVPIDGFVEIVPGVGLVPSTDPFLDGGIGVRVWF